jgi:hypothetical protein
MAYKHIIARLLFLRTAESVFGQLELSALRAQCVAYAVAWIAKHSEWRLPLDQVWDDQAVPATLIDALAIILGAAHKYLGSLDGNPTENAKREACWLTFLAMEIPLNDNWRDSLATNSYRTEVMIQTAMALRWEALRERFRNDPRTLGELETATNRRWIASRRKELVADYIRDDWTSLIARKGLGMRKIEHLIELLAEVPE